MAYLLRKYSQGKWQGNVGLNPLNFNADSITSCYRTSGNKLSVWVSETMDFTAQNVEKLVVALAITMSRPDVMDLVWLSDEWLASNGFELEDKSGDSLYTRVNDEHKNIIDLDLSGLSNIGVHMIGQLSSCSKRYTKKEVIALVQKWMDADKDFSKEDLTDKWQEKLK